MVTDSYVSADTCFPCFSCCATVGGNIWYSSLSVRFFSNFSSCVLWSNVSEKAWSEKFSGIRIRQMLSKGLNSHSKKSPRLASGHICTIAQVEYESFNAWCVWRRFRGGELGVLRVREHPLNMEVHPLTAKSTPSKWKENLMKHRFKQLSNKVMFFMFILGIEGEVRWRVSV